MNAILTPTAARFDVAKHPLYPDVCVVQRMVAGHFMYVAAIGGYTADPVDARQYDLPDTAACVARMLNSGL